MAPVYSPEQVARFLKHIEFPSEYYNGSTQPILDYTFLAALQTHVISTIPYENLQLHYSEKRNVELKPQKLFDRLVLNGKGRGGYCMESNLFLNYMLQALGFQAYMVGVKVRPRKDGVPHGNYMGWVHIVNIVTLPDSTRWVVDVSFGGDGPTRPMPLVEGEIWRNMGTQDARLVLDHLPGQTELTPGRRFWVYQCRNGPELPWTSFYAFSDKVEWMPEDFAVSNCYTGTSPESFQTWTVVVVKFLRRENVAAPGGEEIFAKKMLINKVVKENMGGKTAVVKECKTEQERVEALKEVFGIELTDEEIGAIKGFQTEIKV